MRLPILLLAVVVGGGAVLARQQPAAVDTASLGPQVGREVPPLAGVDQFGKPQTLASIRGSQGAMLVFFRSADW